MPYVPEISQAGPLGIEIEHAALAAPILPICSRSPQSVVPLVERGDSEEAAVRALIRALGSRTRARLQPIFDEVVGARHALNDTAADVMLTPAEPLMSMLLPASIFSALPAWCT